MSKISTLLLLGLLMIPALSAQNKPTPASPTPPTAKTTPLAPELNAAELRQLDRFAALYEELVQQLSEAQTRIKVVQEMQQKLISDYNSFQTAAITARGFKTGEATLDLQARKVTPVPAKAETPATPGR